jgi:hypothetical protein
MVFGLGRNNGADESKYLTIESVGEGKKITEINILMVQKFFEQYFPNLAESRRMRDGRILVMTGNKNEAERAMKITNFCNIHTVAIKPFEPMNMCEFHGLDFWSGIADSHNGRDGCCFAGARCSKNGT